jgi:hypothetical protein
MDEKQLEEYDRKAIELAYERGKLFLEKYEKTQQIDAQLLFGGTTYAHLHDPSFIPSRIFLLFSRPTLFPLDPLRDELAFSNVYNFTPEEMEDLIDRGYAIPIVRNFKIFASLDYMDSLLEKTMRLAREGFGVSEPFTMPLGRVQIKFLEKYWGKEKIEKVCNDGSFLDNLCFPSALPEAQNSYRLSLLQRYIYFALYGYMNLAENYLSLLKRNLISATVFNKIVSTGYALCNQPWGHPVVSYAQIEEFVKWDKVVHSMIERRGIPKNERTIIMPTDVFSFEFVHTLLNLGGHTRDIPLLFNPHMKWDNYLDLLESIGKEFVIINENKLKLLRKEKFKDSIEDFLNTEREMTARFQSIIDSCDKSYKRSKEWFAFGIFTTASVITGNPLPFISGLAYELTKKTPFFDCIGKLVDLVGPQIAGKLVTSKLEEKLAGLYDRLCRYPWATLYLRISQRGLPEHLRISTRNYWVLRHQSK